MNIKRWLHEHSLKLLALRDTPEAIAGGVAIGIFFGFMPLLGLKNLLAIFFAWLTRSNIIAAIVAGALHDVIIPLMPAIYLWEYDVGYWVISHPHHWPTLRHLRLTGDFRERWHMLLTTFGKPLLLGSVICSTPVSILSFFITRGIMIRHQHKRAEQELQEAAAKQDERDIADEV